jgi:hypothetical protein
MMTAERLSKGITAVVLAAALAGVPASADDAPRSAADIRASLSGSEALDRITAFADAMLEHGRDTYGEIHSPMFANQVDIRSRRIPTDEETPFWPIAKAARRPGYAPHASNYHNNTSLMRLLDVLSVLTADNRYADAVTDYVDYIQKVARMKILGNEFWVGGDHAGWDLIADKAVYNWHELRNVRIPWDRFYRNDKAATKQMIENLHLHILNPDESYHFNRHYRVGYSVSLPSSAGTYIYAWAYLYTVTGDDTYLDWARKLSSLYWFNRSEATGYPPTKGEYGKAFPRTTLGGEPARTYALQLLYAASILPEQEARVFAFQAAHYCRAFAALARTPEGFVYEFQIDTGEPLAPPVKDIWREPARLLQIALTQVYAAQLLGDEVLLELCRDMADAILPFGATPDVRNHATEVAQAIEFFRRLHLLTGGKTYQERGQAFVDLAWNHFFRDGFFVALPDGHTYSAFHGSDSLALALLQWEFSRRNLPVFWEPELGLNP